MLLFNLPAVKMIIGTVRMKFQRVRIEEGKLRKAASDFQVGRGFSED